MLQELFWRYSRYSHALKMAKMLQRPTFWQLPIAFSKLVGPELPLFEFSVRLLQLAHHQGPRSLAESGNLVWSTQTVNHLARMPSPTSLPLLNYFITSFDGSHEYGIQRGNERGGGGVSRKG